MTSRVVKTVSRLLFPFLLIFGVYMIAYGHHMPGSGFQGGLVIASAIILIFMTFGTDSLKRLLDHITFLETLGTALFVMVGLIAILFNMNFLGNYLPVSESIPLVSGTLPILNIVIGIKVLAGLVVMYYFLFEMEGKR